MGAAGPHDSAAHELERLADAVSQSRIAIVSLDRESRVRHWSAGAELMFGLRAKEVLGEPAQAVNRALGVPEGATEQARQVFEAILAGGPALRRPGRSRLADGSEIDVLNTFLPWREDGRIVGMTVVVTDTTGRDAGTQATSRLAAIAEASEDAIVGVDLEGLVTIWNTGAERIFGFAKSEIVGRAVRPLVPAANHGEFSEVMGRVFAGERVSGVETVRRRKDGTLVDVSVSVGPVRDGEGRVIGAGSVIRDITEPRRARLADARLAAIVASAGEAIVSTALDGTITTWNPAAERIYGYSAQEAIGQNAQILLDAGPDGDVERLLRDARGGHEPGPRHARRRRKDGTLVELAATAAPLHDAGGAVIGLVSVSQDVTDRRRAERERERTLWELEDAQRLARLGSWRRDPATGEVVWSAQMYALFGRDPADGPVSGLDLLEYIDPADHDRVRASVRPGSERIPEFDLDVRVHGGDGVTRTLHLRGQPDPLNPGAYLGTCQDVTADRQAEAERARLIEASVTAESANRAKSEFLARMSHELRTPLNAIMGFTQLLVLEPLPPEQQEDLAYVIKAGRHLLSLIDEVLDISRIEAGRMTISPEAVPVEATVREAIALVTPQAAGRDIEIGLDVDGIAPGGHLIADRNRLKQILLNLLSNALKYNRPGGGVTVTCTSTPEQRVRIAVADTGLGIEPEHLANLFSPFERLGAEHTEVEGTGLGLTLSKGLVETMGGSIEVETTAGVGSTFTVELAAADPSHAAELADAAAAGFQLHPAPGATSRILYIEDNLSNLALVRRIIERAGGAELIPAMQGGLGLELADHHRPDLILLDLHLPDMDGIEVLKRLRADHRETPIIVLTADARRSRAAYVRRLGAVECLTKPLEIARLIELVAEQLAR